MVVPAGIGEFYKYIMVVYHAKVWKQIETLQKSSIEISLVFGHFHLYKDTSQFLSSLTWVNIKQINL